MNRKWIVLSAVMSLVALIGGRLTIADDDDDSPVHKIMEKVQKENLAITKAVRSATTYKKAGKDVPKHAEQLVKLAKEAREHKEPAQKQKQPYEKWTELMDAFIQTTEQFGKDAETSGAEQMKIKAAYKGVTKRCQDCHTIFRVEDE